MVQSPSWEASWFAASQGIPRISRNPKVHYRTHKRSPPVSILGQPNPVHTPTPHLLEIHPNIIHSSTPRSPQWSLSLRFPQQDPIPTWCKNSLFQYVYYVLLHVSSTVVLIFRRSNCIITASGIATLFGWLFSTQVTREWKSFRNLCTEQPPKDSDDTRCCVNTIVLLKMSTTVLETCRGM